MRKQITTLASTTAATTAATSVATSVATSAAGFALAAALLLAPAAAGAISYTFSGQLDDGPLVGTTFAGSFDFDDSGVLPGFKGDLPLTGFSLLLAGESYTLASADAPPVAVYSDGAFVGLSYVDNDAADPTIRPHIAFIPGFLSLAEAFVGYEIGSGAGQAGFGSYSVAVVPEPASVALLLAGLGVVGWRLRRR